MVWCQQKPFKVQGRLSVSKERIPIQPFPCHHMTSFHIFIPTQKWPCQKSPIQVSPPPNLGSNEQLIKEATHHHGRSQDILHQLCSHPKRTQILRRSSGWASAEHWANPGLENQCHGIKRVDWKGRLQLTQLNPTKQLQLTQYFKR